MFQHSSSPVMRSLMSLALLVAICACARQASSDLPPGPASGSAASAAAPALGSPTVAPSSSTRVAVVRRPPRMPAGTAVPAEVALPVEEQVASVRDAQAQGKLERLSVNGRPSPWRAADYVRDPLPYLSVVEPCRIWQSADPESAEALTTPGGNTAELVNVQPLAQQELRVQTWPGYPASFTSFDRGAFQNGITAITVQADAQGVATAVFTATAGTTDVVRILAASPVTAGQVEFRIHIPAPGSP